MDRRAYVSTDGRTGGHLRPTLSGRLKRVDLKWKLTSCILVSFGRSVNFAELRRPEVARPGNLINFCGFLENDPLRRKVFKILFRKFSQGHRSTLLCSNFVKFCRREICEIVRYLPDRGKKFRLPLTLSLLRGSPPKFAGANPQQCTQSAPDFIQIGSLLAE